MGFKALLAAGLAGARKHEGTILTVISVAGTAIAIWQAVKESPKIMKQLDELSAEGASTFEKAKAVAPSVLKIAIPGGLSMGAAVLNNAKASAKINSLTSMAMMYKAMTDQREKADAEKDKIIKDVAGEDVAKEVNKRAAEQHQAANPAIYKECPTRKIINTGEGTELFHDNLTGCWFLHNKNKIKDRLLEMNFDCFETGTFTVDEYASYLDIDAPDGVDKLAWKGGNKSHTINPEFRISTDGYDVWWEIIFDEYNMPKPTGRIW